MNTGNNLEKLHRDQGSEAQPSEYPKTLVYDELVEMYQLWRDALLHGDKEAQEKQVKLLDKLFKEAGAKSIIDLGGGVGTHSIPLAQTGYDVTIFDASKRALDVVSEKKVKIKTIHGRFEKIELNKNFDASICMWSTINYLLKPEDREHFANWITHHTNRLIVIDQPNVLAYPATFSKEYQVSDAQRKLKIFRDWQINNQVRKTNYLYQITDSNGESREVKDQELQYFMTLEETEALFSQGWKLKNVLGDYDTQKQFEPSSSSRLITTFEKA